MWDASDLSNLSLPVGGRATTYQHSVTKRESVSPKRR